jgi:hypothetical protein
MSIHQYVYQNQSKIDNLYAQMVDRVEEEYRTQHSTEIGGKGEIKTGGVTKFFADAGLELDGKKANSEEVISKLTIENKLKIIQAALKKLNDCTNMNQTGNILDKDVGFISVKTNFTLVDPPQNINDIHKLETFVVEGIFANVNFKVSFSRHGFVSPTIASRLLMITTSGGKIPLRVFGTLILDKSTKIGFIDPVAIYYD